MSKLNILDGTEVNPVDADSFLKRVFSYAKSQFIINHSTWIYRGPENQWFMIVGEQIVAYCAIIPVDCAIQGMRVPALWWVDLIVDRAFRGRGIQSLFDARIRAVADLKLGFPNELAAEIHLKHQWGVREDGDVLLLPLRPGRIKQIKEAEGATGQAFRVAALALAPVAALWRYRIQNNGMSPDIRRYGTADPEVLADLFERYKDQYPATTYRDAAYWRWRYIDAPYSGELQFYLADSRKQPTHCLVARVFQSDGYRVMRLLDWFGDRNDVAGLKKMLYQSLFEAIQLNVEQVTVMNFEPELRSFWRNLGFIARTTGRFCWHSQDQDLMKGVEAGNHWMLGDSDNDAPV